MSHHESKSISYRILGKGDHNTNTSNISLQIHTIMLIFQRLYSYYEHHKDKYIMISYNN